jgi:hypothetical protein
MADDAYIDTSIVYGSGDNNDPAKSSISPIYPPVFFCWKCQKMKEVVVSEEGMCDYCTHHYLLAVEEMELLKRS